MNDLQDRQNQVQAQISGIDHLTLPVHDLDLAERFYTQVLGAEVVYRTDRARPMPFIAITIGNSPSIDLFLQPWGQPAINQVNPHLAFAVRGEDLLDLKQRLIAHQVPVAGPIRFGPPGHGSLYFHDPSGNHLELCARDFTGEVNLEPYDMEKLSYQWQG
ncbi:MAG: VOC family protein [Cyanobacteria bacterium CRU_2_1]|nr:VOC family protein [Cyanobacteria bacterium RU_5_0]NJR59373.1 VOC family protein [Cyanobacteria bacterium CRU_2_1]